MPTASRDRLVRPARPGQDHVGRQGADPLRHRRRRAGGDRDRPRRGRRDLRHRGQPGTSTTVARHGNRARLRLAQHRIRRRDPPRHRRLRRRRRAQLAARCRAARRPGTAGRSAAASSRSASATSTATPASGCSRSAATCRFYAVDLGADDASATPTTVRRLLGHGVPAHGRRRAAAAADHALPDSRRRRRRPAGRRRRAHRQGGARRAADRQAAWPWCHRADARVFRPDGAYVVTGGLGGLGLFLAGEMAAAGCGRIVLNSRSAPNAGDAGGDRPASAPPAPTSRWSCGDVAEPETAERLVAAATATGLPRARRAARARRWSRTPR